MTGSTGYRPGPRRRRPGPAAACDRRPRRSATVPERQACRTTRSRPRARRRSPYSIPVSPSGRRCGLIASSLDGTARHPRPRRPRRGGDPLRLRDRLRPVLDPPRRLQEHWSEVCSSPHAEAQRRDPAAGDGLHGAPGAGRDRVARAGVRVQRGGDRGRRPSSSAATRRASVPPTTTIASTRPSTRCCGAPASLRPAPTKAQLAEMIERAWSGAPGACSAARSIRRRSPRSPGFFASSRWLSWCRTRCRGPRSGWGSPKRKRWARWRFRFDLAVEAFTEQVVHGRRRGQVDDLAGEFAGLTRDPFRPGRRFLNSLPCGYFFEIPRIGIGPR